VHVEYEKAVAMAIKEAATADRAPFGEVKLAT
jgi:hypothetical protein